MFIIYEFSVKVTLTYLMVEFAFQSLQSKVAQCTRMDSAPEQLSSSEDGSYIFEVNTSSSMTIDFYP